MSKNVISTEPFHPGEYIHDAMVSRGWTQDDLADVLGCTRQTVNRLIGGKSAVTPETAIQLAAAFDTSAELWMNLQTSYELALAAKEERDIERKSWLYSQFPVREMQKRHWIGKKKSVSGIEGELCGFFGTESIDQIPAISIAARKGTEYGTETPEQRAWYFKVRNLSNSVSAARYQASNLDNLFSNLKPLLAFPEDIRKVPRLLADFGVKLVIVQHLTKTRIDGVATWVDQCPVIGLSLRFDRLDNFWFNLIHELVHIKYEDKSSVDADVLDADADALPEIEQRANKEAAEFLIPPKKLESFIRRNEGMFSHQKVNQFANARSVHPSIVVGQLQHRKVLPPTHLNKLKAKCREHILGQALTSGWGHTN